MGEQQPAIVSSHVDIYGDRKDVEHRFVNKFKLPNCFFYFLVIVVW